ncbi:acyl-homoserine-lactone synthase [Vibrio sp. CAU 1672]|uniref:acyl-homoserine-lactone synthase n=1 Tax=Vibrio sp. CAU 1672 TaxID=3032594 RepID=UPI0023DCD193|nr:acyl-homoserine-lactone synthase [Vibrio sp. CAU 1672]MDF2154264.1 acyl-homoserine-lactone synthase [Vibrio sp. CAU 1672]
MAHHSTLTLSSLNEHPISGNKLHKLFEEFVRLEATNGPDTISDIFQQRLDAALEKSLNRKKATNISTITASDNYQRAIREPLANASKELNELEQQVHLHFSSWAEFWCEFLIYKLLKKYGVTQLQAGFTVGSLSLNDEDYQAELIDDIGTAADYFLTPYSPVPLTLSDAILISNLQTLVKEEKWYEMLFSIELSSREMHFIMYTPATPSRHKLLLASAKIQPGTALTGWLYNEPFFNQTHWQELNNTHALKILKQHRLFAGLSVVNCSLEDYLRQPSPHAGQICEIIRLALTAPKPLRLYFVYLSQKQLAYLLEAQHFMVAFIVTQNPALLDFYTTLSSDSYIALSRLQLGDEIVYKGMWYLPSVREDFEFIRFRDYKTRLISAKRKQLRSHNHD